MTTFTPYFDQDNERRYRFPNGYGARVFANGDAFDFILIKFHGEETYTFESMADAVLVNAQGLILMLEQAAAMAAA